MTDNTSSQSPDCCKPCCVTCGKKECMCNPCEPICPEEIACKCSNAVVRVFGQFIFIANDSNSIAPIDVPSINIGEKRVDIQTTSNGFFIMEQGHRYILCPASTVLAPPTIEVSSVRYPFQSNSTGISANPVIPNKMIRASRILVGVYNVNNECDKIKCTKCNGVGCSYMYEAKLVGVDGAGDIAVLQINPDEECKGETNRCNPDILPCHPYFPQGRSRSMRPGFKAYMIGDYVSGPFRFSSANGVGMIVEGLVSDHRYTDYSGNILPELVVFSGPAYSISRGMPILDNQGRYIAMQVMDVTGTVDNSVLLSGLQSDPENDTPLLSLNGQGIVAGISTKFMRRVIKSIVTGKCRSDDNCNLEDICDSAGSYYRYVKGYIGIGYNVVDGSDLFYQKWYENSVPGGPGGFPQFILEPNGSFYSGPSNFKKIRGIRVVSIAGANPNDLQTVSTYYTPGSLTNVVPSAPLVQNIPASSAIGTLNYGDIITRFARFGKNASSVELGDIDKQVNPALVTWNLCPNDYINVCYYKGGSYLPSTPSNNGEYDIEYSTKLCLQAYPYVMDYPWFDQSFPKILGNVGYPTLSDAGVDTLYQYPQISGGAIFQPAI